MIHKSDTFFRFSFEEKVWKIHPCLSGNRLLAELRKEESLETFLALLCLDTGRLLWKRSMPSERWWSGLWGLNDETAFLYKYADTQKPLPSGIWALDLADGQVLWSREALRVSAIGADFLEVISGQQTAQTLEAKTGEPLAEDKKRVGQQKKNSPLLQYPFHYPENNTYFATFRAFIQQQKKLELRKAVEYLETAQGFLMASYVENQEKSLDNILWVFDKDGTCLQEILLFSRVQHIGTDTFFVYDQSAVFLQEKNQIGILKYCLQ